MIVVVSGKALSATTVFFGITTDRKEKQFFNDIKLFEMLISFEPSFGYVASIRPLIHYYSMSLLRIYLAKV